MKQPRGKCKTQAATKGSSEDRGCGGERMTPSLSCFPTGLMGPFGYSRPGNRIQPRNTHVLVLTAKRWEEGARRSRELSPGKKKQKQTNNNPPTPGAAGRCWSTGVFLPRPPHKAEPIDTVEQEPAAKAGDHLGSPESIIKPISRQLLV